MPQQFVEPAAANPISVTPNNTAWANSAYTQIIASTGATWYLSSIVVFPASSNTYYEIDIATGAASSETVISTFRGFKLSTTGDVGAPKAHVLPVLLEIPSSSRIAVRIRKSQTGTTAWEVALTYVTSVDAETENTTQPYLCLPSAASGVTNAIPATVWTNSGYAEITASMPNNSVLTHVIYAGLGVNPGDIEIDIAFGAASSEVVQFTLRGATAGSNGSPWAEVLENPYVIPSGTRVSWRFRCSSNTNSGSNVALGINYLETPL